jgi:ParB family chromosome partitioning protein
VFDQSQIRKYFPKSYTTKQMQEKIIQLLEQWQRKQQRDMER